jgi:N-acyl-D-amino-acid deacylase
MAAQFDLVVRGGTVLDGTGGEPHEADIAVQDGRIANIGRIAGAGREEIDAKGLTVTPGFVDIHTHYDGQVTWDDRFTPSSGHGVTTVLMGNCGVGFAPCRPQDRDTLIKVMEGVEDIPELVMREGVPWNWQSFPEYLDALAKRRCDIDFATQVPHAPLRVFVMGRRGVDREPATAADMAAMASLVEEGLDAGALGFTTSRSLFHRTPDGALTPTITAGEEELAAIARGMGRVGKGVIQLLDDFSDSTEGGATEFAMLRRLVELSGRPLSFTLLDISLYPGRWQSLLREVERAQRDGLPIRGQVAGRPVAVLYGLELSFHPFSTCPSYRAIEPCGRASWPRSRSTAIRRCWPSCAAWPTCSCWAIRRTTRRPPTEGSMRGQRRLASRRSSLPTTSWWKATGAPSCSIPAPTTRTAPTPTWRACCGTTIP